MLQREGGLEEDTPQGVVDGVRCMVDEVRRVNEEDLQIVRMDLMGRIKKK